ncbi:MAG: GTP pyrophosphokinase [Clostridium sp.]|nr:GTP pyrophosphokinase [Clostridium sp.]
MITKEELLSRYNISEEEFCAADIAWEDLVTIYNDFQNHKEVHYKKILGKFEKKYLADISEERVHSYRTRVKNPEHLIVKIIRKRNENYQKYKTLTKDNYEKFLTDLIGIRCFILFKSEWRYFHQYIMDKIEDNSAYYVKDCLADFDNDVGHVYMAEPPKVHIRKGDDTDIYNDLLPSESIYSGMDYRSVHYIIKYQGVYLEVQVRTLYEESWGEIDHRMVYPLYSQDPILKEYTKLLNRLTGLADEMGSFFVKLQMLEQEHLTTIGENQYRQGVLGQSEIPVVCEQETTYNAVSAKQELDVTVGTCINDVLNE